MSRSHLLIPDTQVRHGVPLKHLTSLGRLIVDKKPEVIVMIGDFADMESLCRYERGKLRFEGRNYNKDIAASHLGMDTLLEPLLTYNKRNKKKYKPKMVLTLGNHEDRISTAIQESAVLKDTISIDDLKYDEYGWDVIPFLEPIVIDGITYAHYFPNDFSPHPIGRAHLIMNKRHTSATCGHIQMLDYSVSATHIKGKRLQCLIAGSFYLHDEEYRQGQGNENWRGVVYKHDVVGGEYSPEFISIQSLMRKYK